MASLAELMTDPLVQARGLAITRDHEGFGPITTTALSVNATSPPHPSSAINLQTVLRTRCCTSVKTVRLFLTWARETNVVDVPALQQKYAMPVGSEKRWMARLKDGTLLSLKPHG